MTKLRALCLALALTAGCDAVRIQGARWNPPVAPAPSGAAPRDASPGPAPVERRADALRLSVWQRYSTVGRERYDGVVCWRLYFDCRLGENSASEIFWPEAADEDLRCEAIRPTEHPWHRSAGNEWVVPIPQECRRRGYIEAYLDVLPGLDCRPVNAQLAYHSLLGSNEVEHRVVLECASGRAGNPPR